MADVGVKGRMLTWLISFLTDRRIQVTLEDKLSGIYNIDKGVPQGSVLSPILFIILLCTIPNVLPVMSEEFADDLAFLITADNLEDAELLMQDAINRFSEWCRHTRLVLQPLKTKVMCFTKKKVEDPRLFLEDNEIEVVYSHRYLGMVLDSPTLTWTNHINSLISDCRSRLNVLRALGGTTWGARRDVMLKIYITWIRSKILYGCQALIAASPTNIKKLEVIQNATLRLAIGAWNSTFLPALHCEANVVPLQILIEEQTLKHYYEVKSIGLQHPLHDQIFNDIRTRNKVWTKNIFKLPFALKSEELLREWNMPDFQVQRVSLKPILPPWFNVKDQLHLELDMHTTKAMGVVHNNQAALHTLHTRYGDFQKLYTDGSKGEDQTTGAAMFVEEQQLGVKWRIDDCASIVSAELYAIYRALQWIYTNLPRGNVVVLTDSLSSLHLIGNRKLKNYASSAGAIQLLLLQFFRKNWTIHIQWIPEHSNIQGNDRVDQLANEGRALGNINHHVEIQDMYHHLKSTARSHWQSKLIKFKHSS